MAGQERLGRQTPSERQRLIRLGRQTSDGTPSSLPPTAPVRVMGDPPPTQSGTRVRSNFPPSIDVGRGRTDSSKPAFRIEIDDEAETHLYRPPSQPATPSGAKRNSSGFIHRSNHPSKRPAIVSRPGALIMIPADVPSVRVRAESDVDLVVTHPSGAPYEEPEPRRSSPVVRALVLALVVVVLAFVAHEIALAFHLPWLDPKALAGKIKVAWWPLLRARF